MDSPLLDSTILIALRVGFFLCSRRFLLSTLNPTLRDLSSPESSLPLYVADDSDTEPPTPKPGSTASSSTVIELQHVNTRLEARKNRTIQVSHGSETRKADKKETKGLNRAARILFSLCISESCLLVTLVMLHGMGLLSLRSRQSNFTASLYILLAMILIIVPLKQCLLLTYRHSSKSSLSIYLRLVIALVPFGLYVFTFTRIPPYVTSDTETWSGWLAPAFGRVVVMGVIVLGGLSGFGAVRTTWAFYLSNNRSGDDDITQAERSLARVRHDLEAKQAGQSESTWSKRLFGDGELAGLVALEREASRSLADMRERKKNHDFSKTLCGRCYNIIGYVFAIYCAARVIMCLPSLFYPTVDPDIAADGNTNGDWISFFIAFALSKLPIEVDIGVWSRAISLVFTGLIILSSLAQVLRGLTRILKLTSKSIGAGFLLLSLGQLFATYIISLLVQMRTTIPGNPDNDDSLLAFLPDFRIFGRLFDLIFLFTAASTLVYRFVSSKIN